MKYKLTNETKKIKGRILHRIEAIKDFSDVKAGDKGGWIENEKNLSQEGFCWVYNEAKVFGSAKVYENAILINESSVYGRAKVYGFARISGKAEIYGNSNVFGNVNITEKAKIYGNAKVSGYTNFYGNLKVGGFADFSGYESIGGNKEILGEKKMKKNRKNSLLNMLFG